jgi:hypothetical protein
MTARIAKIENVEQILALNKKELRSLLTTSHPLNPEDLAGYVYKGTSVGMPGWVDKALWKTFAKTFYKDPETGQIRGWNIKLKQGKLGDNKIEPLKTWSGKPKTFGHFHVISAADYKTMPLPCHHGLMLDYGLGANSRLDPSRLIRDPLLAIQPGNSDFLIGWSYVALGSRPIGTPSFFVLERHGPIGYVPELS